jgi:hypothetical protein
MKLGEQNSKIASLFGILSTIAVKFVCLLPYWFPNLTILINLEPESEVDKILV